MRKIQIGLVQFDAVPEAVDANLEKMTDWVGKAVEGGAQWIMFHEGTVCDYTGRVSEFAERVPEGRSTTMMAALAKEHHCFISFGTSEVDVDSYFISQVFVGPEGFVYRYRKTWIHKEPEDRGFRNEWARYDPGTGPEIFEFDGVKATCFICADGEAPRCIYRAEKLHPEIVFYPNNRGKMPEHEVFGGRARAIRAPMLFTNRTGISGTRNCPGGCAFYSASGEVLAQLDRDGREGLLLYDLEIPSTSQ